MPKTIDGNTGRPVEDVTYRDEPFYSHLPQELRELLDHIDTFREERATARAPISRLEKMGIIGSIAALDVLCTGSGVALAASAFHKGVQLGWEAIRHAPVEKLHTVEGLALVAVGLVMAIPTLESIPSLLISGDVVDKVNDGRIDSMADAHNERSDRISAAGSVGFKAYFTGHGSPSMF